MRRSGQTLAKRRAANAQALAAFGVDGNEGTEAHCFRCVRKGNGITLFTVGYERRSGDELIALLRQAGVECLVDVRDKPISRKPDFRPGALQDRCDRAKVRYESWPVLGSTDDQRRKLRETGNFKEFRSRFRAYAKRHKGKALDRLAKTAKTAKVALLCYERPHEECHRSVVADLVADRLGATIMAI